MPTFLPLILTAHSPLTSLKATTRGGFLNLRSVFQGRFREWSLWNTNETLVLLYFWREAWVVDRRCNPQPVYRLSTGRLPSLMARLRITSIIHTQKSHLCFRIGRNCNKKLTFFSYRRRKRKRGGINYAPLSLLSPLFQNKGLNQIRSLLNQCFLQVSLGSLLWAKQTKSREIWSANRRWHRLSPLKVSTKTEGVIFLNKTSRTLRHPR
jgi:hypothetical protein